MIHKIVTLYVLPGKTEEFEVQHRRLLETLCAQSGCVEIRVHRSLANPHEYLVYGTWDSKQSWDRAHQTTEQFKSLFSSF
jgi:quinol monooxygenase YgiN